MQCGCCTTVSSKNQGSRCEHGIGSRTCESFPPHSPDVISRHISEVELQEPVVSAELISRKTACLAGPGHSCLFFRCSTLNVPPPRIPTWEAPSPRDGIWEWGLWEVSGSRGWSLMNRMSALCTEGTPPQNAPVPSTVRGLREKTSSYQPETWPAPGTAPAWANSSWTATFQNREKETLFQSHTMDGIFVSAARMDEHNDPGRHSKLSGVWVTTHVTGSVKEV